MDRKILIPILVFFLVLPITHADIGNKECETNRECYIGEFVYNENYTAHTLDICTINITHPNETIAVKDGAMSNHSDGFYNYTFIPIIEGYHKAEIYCINGTDTGRIDKSFVIGSTNTSFLGIALILAAIIFTFAYLSIKINEKYGFIQFLFLMLSLILMGLATYTAKQMAENNPSGISGLLTTGFEILMWTSIIVLGFFIIFVFTDIFQKLIDFAKRKT